LPNNQRQHRTTHAPKDVLPLRICTPAGPTPPLGPNCGGCTPHLDSLSEGSQSRRPVMLSSVNVRRGVGAQKNPTARTHVRALSRALYLSLSLSRSLSLALSRSLSRARALSLSLSLSAGALRGSGGCHAQASQRRSRFEKFAGRRERVLYCQPTGPRGSRYLPRGSRYASRTSRATPPRRDCHIALAALFDQRSPLVQHVFDQRHIAPLRITTVSSLCAAVSQGGTTGHQRTLSLYCLRVRERERVALEIENLSRHASSQGLLQGYLAHKKLYPPP